MNDGKTISSVINEARGLCAEMISMIIKMTGDRREWTSQIVDVDPVPLGDDSNVAVDNCCCDGSNEKEDQ